MSVNFTTSVAGTMALGAQAQPVAAQVKPASGDDLPGDLIDPTVQDRGALAEAVNSLRSNVQSVHRNLEFSLDDDSGLTIVRVVDTSNGEVIRQIPSEVVVKLAESFRESSNLLLKEKV